MKNYEKYAEEVREYSRENNFCNDFIIPHIFKPGEHCYGVNCGACRMRQMIWLLEDYTEPEVDWSEVKVDAPILVRDNENTVWMRKHFAKYENGFVWTWLDDRTSWTAPHADNITWWKYAKLAESEEGDAK